MSSQEYEHSFNPISDIDSAVGDETENPFRLLPDGGRIKAGSISPTILYDLAEDYMLDPSAEAAYNVTRGVDLLRKKPPQSILVSFFPLDRQTIQQNIRGAGLYRPFLKTDQGPAGNFTGFTFENNANQQFQIMDEYGYVIPEVHISEMIAEHPAVEEMNGLIEEIDMAYREGDYAGCSQLIQIFKESCGALGIQSDRTADVGRGAFFFCRPVSTEPSASLAPTLQSDIEARVNDIVRRIEARAQMIRFYVGQGIELRKAVQLVERDSNQAPAEISPIAYFQADVFVGKSGRVLVDQIQYPDVGFFLTALDPRGNPEIERVGAINRRLVDEAATSIVDTAKERDGITIVTRDEVVEQKEDTLELLEIQALTQALTERGLRVEIASLSEAIRDPNSDLLLLLNLRQETSAYRELIEQVAHGDKVCYPDPFVQLCSPDATDLRRIVVEGLHLRKFIEAVRPIKGGFNQQNAHHRMRTIENILTRAGIAEDIIYFDIPGEYAPVPTFRYSPHSFAQVYNAVNRQSREGNNVDRIVAKPIPFDRTDQRLMGEDGPRLAAFRTMFVRR